VFMSEQFPKKISKKYSTTFSTDQSGFYKIIIAAHCEKSQDLRVEVDGIKLREIPAEEKPQYMNIPPAWNGAQLKGLKKTVVFILKLDKDDHTITFISNNEAVIEGFNTEYIPDSQNIQFNLEKQAQDGDRRPWYTFVLIDLPLKSITADVTVKWHFLDGDDAKLIIDNTIKTNPYSIFHRNWVWSAGILRKIFGIEREEKTFTENLGSGVHYIEFWADRTPTLHSVKLDLGFVSLKRTPTVDDPQWTGNFADDTEEMILARLVFGEARNQSVEAMKGVAWVVKNRLMANRSDWGNTYHLVILPPDQFSAMNPEDDNFPILIDPLNTESQVTKDAWKKAYEVAREVINGSVDDPTEGALFFHSADYPQQKFITQDVPGAIFAIKIDDMLFYKI